MSTITHFQNTLSESVYISFIEAGPLAGEFYDTEIEVKPGETIQVPKTSIDEYHCILHDRYMTEILKFATKGYMYHGFYIMYEKERYKAIIEQNSADVLFILKAL